MADPILDPPLPYYFVSLTFAAICGYFEMDGCGYDAAEFSSLLDHIQEEENE